MAGFLIIPFLLMAAPLVISLPVLGPLVYYWLTWMRPETQMYGVLPLRWTLILAVTALVSALLRANRWEFPRGALAPVLIIFAAWYVIATLSNPGADMGLAGDFVKIILMTLVSASILTTRIRVHAVIWVVLICIGIAAVRTAAIVMVNPGGRYVLGPDYLGQTNEYARVLLYTFPLALFMARHSAHHYVRFGMLVLTGCIALSVIGTNSRGGMVAFLVMCGIMWLKGRRKIPVAIGILIFAGAVFLVIPEGRIDSFFSRMQSIETADKNASFLSRTAVWKLGWEYVQAHPVFGGGAGLYERVFLIASHNSYLEILGEMGFPGFALWLLIALLAFRLTFRIRRLSRDIADLRWAYDLAYYSQLMFIGYFVGGFLKNHGLFEFYYMLIGILMGTAIAVQNYLISKATDDDQLASTSPMKRLAQAQISWVGGLNLQTPSNHQGDVLRSGGWRQ